MYFVVCNYVDRRLNVSRGGWKGRYPLLLHSMLFEPRPSPPGWLLGTKYVFVLCNTTYTIRAQENNDWKHSRLKQQTPTTPHVHNYTYIHSNTTGTLGGKFGRELSYMHTCTHAHIPNVGYVTNPVLGCRQGDLGLWTLPAIS